MFETVTVFWFQSRSSFLEAAAHQCGEGQPVVPGAADVVSITRTLRWMEVSPVPAPCLCVGEGSYKAERGSRRAASGAGGERSGRSPSPAAGEADAPGAEMRREGGGLWLGVLPPGG